MKRNLSIVFVIFLFSFSGILAKDVKKSDFPKVIITAFEKEYPNAKIKEYEIENEYGRESYNIEFTKDNKNYEAQYNKDGTFVQLEEESNIKALPKAVIDSFNKKYPNNKIKDVVLIYRNKALYAYEISFKSGKAETEVMFDSSGNELKN